MGSQTQKTQVELPDSLQQGGYLGLAGADQWYRNRPNAFNTGYQNRPSQYVGISPERQEGLNLLYGSAQTPGQVPGDVLQEYGRTVRGEYLTPESNPFLSSVIEQMQEDILPGVAGGYAAAGRYGSGSMANAITDTMGDISARTWADNYANERTRMMQAQSMAPQMQALEWADPMTRARMLEGVGGAYEADQRGMAAEDLAQYQEPLRTMSSYQQLIGSSPQMAMPTTTAERPFDWGSFMASLVGAGGMLGSAALGLPPSAGAAAGGGPASAVAGMPGASNPGFGTGWQAPQVNVPDWVWTSG